MFHLMYCAKVREIRTCSLDAYTVHIVIKMVREECYGSSVSPTGSEPGLGI